MSNIMRLKAVDGMQELEQQLITRVDLPNPTVMRGKVPSLRPTRGPHDFQKPSTEPPQS